MNYKGKLIGFLLGLWLGNWIGALFGLWIGHAYDIGKRRQQGFSFRREPTRAEQALFFHTTFAVMGHIAKAMSEDEVKAVADGRVIRTGTSTCRSAPASSPPGSGVPWIPPRCSSSRERSDPLALP